MNIQKDTRLPQARKLITSMVGKKELSSSNILITGDNTLVIIVYETAIYTTKLNNIQPGFPISFIYSEIENLGEDEYIQNNYIFGVINDTYNRYIAIENNQMNMVASDPDLRSDEYFDSLLAMKAADGAKFFSVMGFGSGAFYIPIFAGFPSINKADKIGVNIYDIGDGHFLNVLVISKKKINRVMKIYFRTINLGRRENG